MVRLISTGEINKQVADKIWTMNGTLATETPVADADKLTPEWYTG